MLRTLVRLGLVRGVGGSRGWMVVGLAAGGVQLLRRAAKREAETVYLEPLHPGQSVVIEHFPRTR